MRTSVVPGRWWWAVVFASALCMASSASGAIVNRGFESELTGWETEGSVSTLGATARHAPPERQQAVRLRTAVAESSAIEDLETFAGLQPGALSSDLGRSVIRGRAVRQTFSADPGQQLQFQWNFFTDDSIPNVDFGFVAIDGQLQVLADTQSPLLTFDPPTAPISPFEQFTTGYQTATLPLEPGGEHTVVFGVTGDATIGSLLLVDDVRLVPAPASLALLLAATPWLWHRRR